MRVSLDRVPADWRGPTAVIRVPEGYRLLLVVKGKARWFGTFRNESAEEVRRFALELAGRRLSEYVPDDTWLVVPYESKTDALLRGAWFNADFCAFSDPNPGFESKLNRYVPEWEKRRRRALVALRKERNTFLAPSERFALAVPFPQKHRAEAAGALFDYKSRTWYTGKDDTPELLTGWIPKGKTLPGRDAYRTPPGFFPYPRVLAIDPEDETSARAKGALFWKSEELWLAPKGMPEDVFAAEGAVPLFDGPELACIDYMRKTIGCAPETVLFDGEIHRFSSEPGRKPDCAYLMWSDGIPGGWFADNRLKRKLIWHFDTHGLFWNEESFPPTGKCPSDAQKSSLLRP